MCTQPSAEDLAHFAPQMESIKVKWAPIPQEAIEKMNNMKNGDPADFAPIRAAWNDRWAANATGDDNELTKEGFVAVNKAEL